MKIIIHILIFFGVSALVQCTYKTQSIDLKMSREIIKKMYNIRCEYLKSLTKVSDMTTAQKFLIELDLIYSSVTLLAENVGGVLDGKSEETYSMYSSYGNSVKTIEDRIENELKRIAKNEKIARLIEEKTGLFNKNWNYLIYRLSGSSYSSEAWLKLVMIGNAQRHFFSQHSKYGTFSELYDQGFIDSRFESIPIIIDSFRYEMVVGSDSFTCTARGINECSGIIYVIDQRMIVFMDAGCICPSLYS